MKDMKELIEMLIQELWAQDNHWRNLPCGIQEDARIGDDHPEDASAWEAGLAVRSLRVALAEVDRFFERRGVKNEGRKPFEVLVECEDSPDYPDYYIWVPGLPGASVAVCKQYAVQIFGEVSGTERFILVATKKPRKAAKR